MEMINTKTIAFRRVVRVLHEARDGDDANKAAWATKVLADSELFKEFFQRYCEEFFGKIGKKKN